MTFGFFFKQKTAYEMRISDWSSDVCSSDLSDADHNHDVVIDMDKVADAVGLEGEKHPFYVSEQSQQHKFNCKACGEFNDILGRYGYCSRCGTRNDLAFFEGVAIPAIKDRLNSGALPEGCVRNSK